MIKNPKILIIDDIKDNISIAKALIKKNYPDAIVLSSLNAELGIELVKSTIPDVILLDILMPGTDGFEVCKILKNDNTLDSIPVVFVTALKENKETKIRAIEVGAEGFLTKPIDEASLITMINAMLKVRESEIAKIDYLQKLERLVDEKTKKLKEELEEKILIENSLRNSDNRYLELINNLGSGIVIHAPDTEIVGINEKAASLLGLSVDVSKGKVAKDPYWKFFSKEGESLSTDEFPVYKVLNTLKPLKNYVIRIVTGSNQSVWLKVNGFPRFNANGELMEIVISFIDITESILYENKLEFAANNDHLTKLFNRRYFEMRLKEINEKDTYPVTIAIADINGLKLVNDAFGHIYGDKMLCHAASVIKDAVAPGDIVARIGGDEFGIIMVDSDSETAREKISRITELAKTKSVQSIELSISVGYYTKNNANIDLFEVTKAAEDIMYRQKLIEIPSMRSSAIETILMTLHEKDKYSEYHSRQVSMFAEKLATAYGLENQKVNMIKTAGLVHDIGKIIIPLEIINKKGSLTEKEREVINTHPEIGFRILNSSSELREISNIVLNHHERYDGNGYPRSIKGKDIPIESRIIAVCDAFDAMTSERSYRQAIPIDIAKQEIIDCKGSQFDPGVVDVFITNFDDIAGTKNFN